MDDKSSKEVMAIYRDKNRLFSLEGSSGIKTLNKICNEIGYREQEYANGSSLEEFLRDNPGCCEAILEWIIDHMDDCSDWKESLSFEDDIEPEDGNIEHNDGP